MSIRESFLSLVIILWGGIYKRGWDILKAMIIKLPKEDDLIMMCRQIAFIGHYQRYESYKLENDKDNNQKWSTNF